MKRGVKPLTEDKLGFGVLRYTQSIYIDSHQAKV